MIFKVPQNGNKKNERERREREREAARNCISFLPVNVPRCSQALSATASGSEPA